MHNGCGGFKQACRIQRAAPAQLRRPCARARACKEDRRESAEHEVKPKAKDGEAKYLVSARLSLPIPFASLLELSPLILPFSLLLSAAEFGLSSKVEACSRWTSPTSFPRQSACLIRAWQARAVRRRSSLSSAHCRHCAALQLVAGYIFCCCPLWAQLA